jgi:hypothetical protein
LLYFVPVRAVYGTIIYRDGKEKLDMAFSAPIKLIAFTAELKSSTTTLCNLFHPQLSNITIGYHH